MLGMNFKVMPPVTAIGEEHATNVLLSAPILGRHSGCFVRLCSISFSSEVNGVASLIDHLTFLGRE
jgi:hypothetical protein